VWKVHTYFITYSIATIAWQMIRSAFNVSKTHLARQVVSLIWTFLQVNRRMKSIIIILFISVLSDKPSFVLSDQEYSSSTAEMIRLLRIRESLASVLYEYAVKLQKELDTLELWVKLFKTGRPRRFSADHKVFQSNRTVGKMGNGPRF